MLVVRSERPRLLRFLELHYFSLFGGIQTLWGPVLGALLLTVLPEALRFASAWRLILYGLIIVLVVLIRPEGLLRRKTIKGQGSALDPLKAEP